VNLPRLLCILPALIAGSVVPQALRAEAFSFVALGDTTYEVPADEPLYESLIATINAAAPEFSIHVGDTKGRGDCGDAFQLKQKAYFDSFAQPVVYAFGNNEWADCWKDDRGKHDPITVLNAMRAIFYPGPYSLGKRRLPLQRQSDGAAFPAFAENVRWTHGGVTFLTVNVVGEHNNQLVRDQRLWREFVERERANLAWIEAGFAAARAARHQAVVIALHSDIFGALGQLEGGAFQPVLQAVATGAAAFAGQVLVVHGHEHTFIIDRPLREWDDAATTSVHDNLSRLQVYGWPDMKAVRVTVDTDTPWVFGFEPLYGERSLSPAFTD
jgi:hypothetical protein